MQTPPTWLIAILIPVLLKLSKSKPLPSRETIIKPNEERVVLLGASSGVGHDLALAYAKRGAKICLFARRKQALDEVYEQCLALGCSNVLRLAGDITNPDDLVRVREEVIKAWGGIDTVHILAGVPSTSTLLDIAGSPLTSAPSGPSSANPLATKRFAGDADTEGLKRVADEARACGEINYIGTTLALAAFLPLLSQSPSPVLHHLSSVAATVPAPRRTIYAASKAAGLMAVESCRVECEGSGVRFFSLLPGTIDNGFRLKTATSQTGGACEVHAGVKHSFEKLLLPPEKVVEVIFEQLAINPAPAPLIPYFPFNLVPWLKTPPKHLVHIPWQYRLAFMVRDTPLGWLYVEPAARRKYAID